MIDFLWHLSCDSFLVISILRYIFVISYLYCDIFLVISFLWNLSCDIFLAIFCLCYICCDILSLLWCLSCDIFHVISLSWYFFLIYFLSYFSWDILVVISFFCQFVWKSVLGPLWSVVSRLLLCDAFWAPGSSVSRPLEIWPWIGSRLVQATAALIVDSIKWSYSLDAGETRLCDGRDRIRWW